MLERSKVFNKLKGDIGERQASEFLKKKKYKILETNHRNYIGEIDIIAKDKNTIVFVEVKSRSTYAYGQPIEAVDSRKVNKIRKTAELYLAIKKQSLEDVRFDVIEICDEKINHIENAF